MKLLDHSQNRMNPRSRPRTGLLIISLLATLVAGSMILFGAISFSLKQHRQARNELLLEQTRWVLDAGMSRAIAALRVDANYQGESVKLGTPLREYQPTITISIERSRDGEPVIVEVVARLERLDKTPIDLVFRRSHRFEFLN